MPRELTAAEQMDLGRAEAERLRPARAVNYEVKRAAGFRCQAPGCKAGSGLLVVTVDGELEARCAARHIGDHVVAPGQWVERA